MPRKRGRWPLFNAGGKKVLGHNGRKKVAAYFLRGNRGGGGGGKVVIRRKLNYPKDEKKRIFHRPEKGKAFAVAMRREGPPRSEKESCLQKD